MAKIKRGDVSGSSFAFTVNEDDEQWTFTPHEALPLRTILRAHLLDISPVTYPAYPATTAVARTSLLDTIAVREREAAARKWIRRRRGRIAAHTNS